MTSKFILARSDSLGSARASRARFGASPKQILRSLVSFHTGNQVRDGEGAIASTRGACAPRIFALCSSSNGNSN